jgi:hypothetical protein
VDGPLAPIATGILWYMEMIPGPLALIFSAEDFGSFLWALCAWRAELPIDGNILKVDRVRLRITQEKE